MSTSTIGLINVFCYAKYIYYSDNLSNARKKYNETLQNSFANSTIARIWFKVGCLVIF
jgi:hypothetical protein